jgi:hypothetical protein
MSSVHLLMDAVSIYHTGLSLYDTTNNRIPNNDMIPFIGL